MVDTTIVYATDTYVNFLKFLHVLRGMISDDRARTKYKYVDRPVSMEKAWRAVLRTPYIVEACETCEKTNIKNIKRGMLYLAIMNPKHGPRGL